MVVVGFGRSYLKTKESSCCVKCWFNSETANEQQHLLMLVSISLGRIVDHAINKVSLSCHRFTVIKALCPAMAEPLSSEATQSTSYQRWALPYWRYGSL